MRRNKKATLKEIFEDWYQYDEVRKIVGTDEFDRLSRKKKERMVKLNYLAEILVGAYFDMKESRRGKGLS